MGKQELLSSIVIIDKQGRRFTFQTLARRGAKEILYGGEPRFIEGHMNENENRTSEEPNPEETLPKNE